jgi:hypothetical protein
MVNNIGLGDEGVPVRGADINKLPANIRLKLCRQFLRCRIAAREQDIMPVPHKLQGDMPPDEAIAAQD